MVLYKKLKTIDNTSELEIDDITVDSSLVIPRLSTTQRDASGAVNGNIIYNTTTNKFEAYVNNVWVEVVVGSGGGFVTLADAQTITGVKTFKNNETKFESTAGTLYCTIKDDKTINLPEVGSSYNIKNNVALSESQILPFSTNTTIANNIKITGGVGMKIGDTVDPTSILHLKSINPSLQIEGTTCSLLFKSGTQSLLSFGFGTEISHITGNNLKFINGVNTLLEIDSVGKMGIADSAPQAHVSLDVGSSISGTGIMKLPKVTTINQRPNDLLYNGGLWYNIDTNQFMIMQNGTKQALHHSSNSLDIASVQSSTGIKTFTNGSNHGNINIATDTISNSNTNSDIKLLPNGTGVVDVLSDLNISSGNLLFAGISGTNVSILNGALANKTINVRCVAIGKNSQLLNNQANDNVSVGDLTLQKCLAGSTTAVGSGALQELTTGSQNTAYGYNSLAALKTGICNTFVGFGAGTSLGAGGQRNTVVGANALPSGAAGASFNVCIGDATASNLSSATGNVLLGTASGTILTSGGNNILIGTSSNVDLNVRDNTIQLGNGITKPFNNAINIATTLNGGYSRAFIQGIKGITPAVASPDLVVVDSAHQLGSIPNTIVKNNEAATDPLTTDDSTQGYSVFSLWRNTTNNTIWQCSNNSVGAAIWSLQFGSKNLQVATISSFERSDNAAAYVSFAQWIYDDKKQPSSYTVMIRPNATTLSIRIYNISTATVLAENTGIVGGTQVINFQNFVHSQTNQSLYACQCRKDLGGGSYDFISLRSNT